MQGEAIVHALIELGMDVVEMVDNAPHVCFDAYRRINKPKRTRVVSSNSPTDFDGEPLDLVFSAAPYNVNIEIAKECNRAGVPYADLGGNPFVSETIQNNAVAIYPERSVPQSPVFTDLGCAPGWVSIIAEELIRGREDGAKISMCVGGLPRDPEGLPWKYGIVFSPNGLYNEYTGDCDFLALYVKATAPALSGHRHVSTLAGNLEAFNTKGGMGLSLHNLMARGVHSAQYQTLRYKGHWDILDNLLNNHRYTEEQFTTALKENCPVITEDIVVGKVEVEWSGLPKERRIREFVILADGRFTAMQKATAFPAAAAALLMTQGMVETFSPVCDYQGVPCRMFNEYLKRLKLIR